MVLSVYEISASHHNTVGTWKWNLVCELNEKIQMQIGFPDNYVLVTLDNPHASLVLKRHISLAPSCSRENCEV